MKRRTWHGHGGPVEKLGVTFNARIIRKPPKPAQTYGSPAWELKREEAEREAAEREAAEKARAEQEASSANEAAAPPKTGRKR